MERISHQINEQRNEYTIIIIIYFHKLEIN